MDEQIKKGIEVVKKGGIIIFPTDTAFGIGCRVDDPYAVAKLFSIRKRPVTQATPVLVDTVTMAEKYVTPIKRDVMDELIEKYWPGALTIVMPCLAERVPGLVRGGGMTMGVRIPNHPVIRTIIRETGIPILGPSANFHGGETPYRLADVDPQLITLVDHVVPGVCTVKEASTVIDVTVSPWKILRQGAIRL